MFYLRKFNNAKFIFKNFSYDNIIYSHNYYLCLNLDKYYFKKKIFLNYSNLSSYYFNPNIQMIENVNFFLCNTSIEYFNSSKSKKKFFKKKY